MKNIIYHQDIGSMAAYTKKATEDMVGLVQRKEKIATEDCFVFVS